MTIIKITPSGPIGLLLTKENTTQSPAKEWLEKQGYLKKKEEENANVPSKL